jgi:glycopeptide antibiotics resistance protein
MKNWIYKGIGYLFLYVLILFTLWVVKWDFIALTPFTSVALSAIILINVYALFKAVAFRSRRNTELLLIAYFSFVAGILFLRNPNLEYQYSFSWYLTNWSKHLFSNRIIFINVVGNILLFIPLGMMVRSLYPSWLRYFATLLVIIALESVQYITKLGVFDLTDMVLNYLGILLGFALYHLRKGVNI